MKRRRILIALTSVPMCALIPGRLAAQSMQLEIIELRARTADEVIPILEPMLAPGGSISGLKDKVIIRTSPSNLFELRKILEIVDARPRRLLITVRQDADVLREERGVELSTTIDNGRVRVEVPRSSESTRNDTEVKARRRGNRVGARVHSTDLDDSRQSMQTVQVLEGNAAFISMGESLPIKDQSTSVGVGGVVTSESTSIRNVTSGFYAKPRISGNHVTVQLSVTADSIVDRETGAARIQRVTSVISGTVGEWIEVGGVTSSAEGQRSGTISHSSNLSRDQRRTFIKVEEIH